MKASARADEKNGGNIAEEAEKDIRDLTSVYRLTKLSPGTEKHGDSQRLVKGLTPRLSMRDEVLDYCDVVWHECGQGNSDKIEQLQRRAAWIVYFKAAPDLSTDQILTKLG